MTEALPETDPMPENPPAAGHAIDRPDVMIVDDTPANLDLLNRMLRAEGYRIRPAPNGKLALRAARIDPPDIILLDINMPEMDGYAVCRALKADERLREIPVLFLSARMETADKVTAFQAGGVDYITKPFQAEEMLARIRTHLNLKRYRQELENRNSALNSALETLRQTQNQLIQSEKMAALGVLTAGIAHEINNPLNFIQTSITGLRHDITDLLEFLAAFSERVETGAPSPLAADLRRMKQEVEYEILIPEINTLMETIQEGVQRTREIVDSIQTLSRRDGKPVSGLRLHDTIDAALLILKNRYKRRITVETGYADLPPMTYNPGRISQVMTNLIANAIDALEALPDDSPEKRIEIRTERIRRGDHAYAAIRVSDNGPGIAPDLQSKIFDPFFTTKEVGRGTGLGLYISRTIIQEHGGRIAIAPREGGGTIASVCLPLT